MTSGTVRGSGAGDQRQVAESVAPWWEPWSDNLPLEEQVSKLRDVMLAWYPAEPSQAGGVIETAARLLCQAALIDGRDGAE